MQGKKWLGLLLTLLCLSLSGLFVSCLLGPLHRCTNTLECSEGFVCAKSWCIPPEVSKASEPSEPSESSESSEPNETFEPASTEQTNQIDAGN